MLVKNTLVVWSVLILLLHYKQETNFGEATSDQCETKSIAFPCGVIYERDGRWFYYRAAWNADAV